VKRGRDFRPDGQKAGGAALSRPTGYELCEKSIDYIENEVASDAIPNRI